jgi:flagellar basal-body rod modification protein FlgD
MAIDTRLLAASSGLLGDPMLAALGSNTLGASRIDRGADRSDVFGLGRDDFFKLFLAQLRNQDPTKPLEDRDFVAQLAQFTLIDTMQEVKRVLTAGSLAQAAALIGRSVVATTDEGYPVAGIVDHVVQSEGGIALVVDGQLVRPEAVTQVTEPLPGPSSVA